jgi:hypothetical protein
MITELNHFAASDRGNFDAETNTEPGTGGDRVMALNLTLRLFQLRPFEFITS